MLPCGRKFPPTSGAWPIPSSPLLPTKNRSVLNILLILYAREQEIPSSSSINGLNSNTKAGLSAFKPTTGSRENRSLQEKLVGVSCAMCYTGSNDQEKRRNRECYGGAPRASARLWICRA